MTGLKVLELSTFLLTYNNDFLHCNTILSTKKVRIIDVACMTSPLNNLDILIYMYHVYRVIMTGKECRYMIF